MTDKPAGIDAPPAALDGDFRFVSRKLVMYPDLNAHGRLFGGQLMSWIDEGLAQVAARLMGTTNLVTKKFGEVVFINPGLLGDSIEIWCRVEREGTTSLTLECRALARRGQAGGKVAEEICRSSVVYVALDGCGKPRPWRA
jgi:acyl-CoA hydrolase